jgi:hypothetical protein
VGSREGRLHRVVEAVKDTYARPATKREQAFVVCLFVSACVSLSFFFPFSLLSFFFFLFFYLLFFLSEVPAVRSSNFLPCSFQAV